MANGGLCQKTVTTSREMLSIMTPRLTIKIASPLMQNPAHCCPEMRHLEELLQYSSPLLRHHQLCEVNYQGERYPVHSLVLGSQEADAPAIAFVGGVHGVERIGTQVVLAFLETLLQRLQWDRMLIEHLNQLRLVFIPLVNPVGMSHHSRANGNGVDLMRNAPVDAQHRPAFLVGGQRISRAIPWYRGKANSAMETEAQALCDEIRAQLFNAPFSLVLDVHSGFGFTDRLWFPYANSFTPVPHLAELYNLKQLLQRTYPHLDYLFEPQAHNYTTHGDIWDYLYMDAVTQKRLFLPLTLELGSWRWVKKNPRQLFSALGMFNPIVPHRIQRVLRRHITLMEFLLRATLSFQAWQPMDNERVNVTRAAMRHWYEPHH